MVKKIYECRLCHRIVYEESGNLSYCDANLKMQNDVRYTENRIHFCDENSMGILCFLGVKNMDCEGINKI